MVRNYKWSAKSKTHKVTITLTLTIKAAGSIKSLTSWEYSLWLAFTKQRSAVKDHHVDFDDIRNIVDLHCKHVTTVKNLVSSTSY